MPAFYMLSAIAIIAVFFLISFLYKPIGKLIDAIVKEFKINAEIEEEKENEK